MSAVAEVARAEEANIEGGDVIAVNWDELGIDPDSDDYERPVVLCNAP